MTRTTAKLSLDFTRLAGRWTGRKAVEEALAAILPRLVRVEGSLPAGRYSITVALTNDAHQRDLNHQFRGINRPTNVLSFPTYGKRALKKLPAQRETYHLGDISLADQYITAEAQRDGKKRVDHIIHLVIHGILHILGHDHQTARQAAVMEQLERDILALMKIADPYAINDHGTSQPSSLTRRNPRKA